MSTSQYPAATSSAMPRVALTAGSAFKFGFFGALGVFVFYLIVSVVFVVIGLVLAAAGTFNSLLPYLQR